MRSLGYLSLSLKKIFLGEGRDCPSCGASSPATKPVDRKWLITTLQRCVECRLLYRTPTTTSKENETIYQQKYREGRTTELPSGSELDELIKTRFQGSPYDYNCYLEILTASGVKAGAKIYDFGCSWGYGSYQLMTAGYNVVAYEISTDRAAFAADRLGVSLQSPDLINDETFDVFFSAHVLEHVPSVERIVATARRLLRPGGLFLGFTPNGSRERRLANPDGWHHAWGFVHPQLLDREWVEARAEASVVADTTPYSLDAIAEGRSSGNWSGEELMIAFRCLD